MQSVKNWCLAVSCVSILSGITLTLIPKGTMKNTYRVLVCIVILFTFTSSVKSLKAVTLDFNKILSSYSESLNDENSVSNTLFVAEETYENYIESALSGIISKAECECVCQYENQSLTITSITITGDFAKEDEEKIMIVIKDMTDENTVVSLRGGEYGRQN